MSPAEIERLRRQHETWRALTEAVWQMAGVGARQTVVDLGCGPGFTSLDLARIVGDGGRVVAVDASVPATEFLRASAAQHASNLEIVTADVGEADMAAWRPDVVFARWLFCYLPRPDEVIAHVAAGLRPGAVVAVVDYWHYLAIRTEPPSPTFRRVFQAVYDSFRDAGGSLDVAGRLPALFDTAGIAVRSIEPLCRVGRPGSPIWSWISDFQDIYLPTLVAGGYLTAEEAGAHLAWWTAEASNPAAFVFAPPMLAVIGQRR